MARARVQQPSEPANPYQRLLERERQAVQMHPAHYDRTLLKQLEAGEPVKVFGYRVGFPGVECLVHPDGFITATQP